VVKARGLPSGAGHRPGRGLALPVPACAPCARLAASPPAEAEGGRCGAGDARRGATAAVGRQGTAIAIASSRLAKANSLCSHQCMLISLSCSDLYDGGQGELLCLAPPPFGLTAAFGHRLIESVSTSKAFIFYPLPSARGTFPRRSRSGRSRQASDY
jgi:hypothetical protein